MKILFLGDSITEGVGASSEETKYVNVVAKICSVETCNFGVSGTRIARQTKPYLPRTFDYDFQMRAEVMDKDADLAFVFGGTNDYGHGDAEIGSTEDTSPYTFYGGLNNLFAELSAIYGKDKICFILPARRFAENDPCGGGRRKPTLPLKGYVDIIRSFCVARGVDYIDLYNDGFPVPTTDKGDEYTTDGLHPNDKGHAFIAEKIKEYLVKKGKINP